MNEYVIQNSVFLLIAFCLSLFYFKTEGRAKNIMLFITVAFLAAGISGFVSLVIEFILSLMGM